MGVGLSLATSGPLTGRTNIRRFFSDQARFLTRRGIWTTAERKSEVKLIDVSAT
jgi:hypothetical protein